VEVGAPFRGRQIIAAVRGSGGSAVAIQDGAIEAARRELAALEGLDVEPTAALAFAAAVRLRELGTIDADDRVAIPTTGSGLKDLPA
jgi:threonine synthase